MTTDGMEKCSLKHSEISINQWNASILKFKLFCVVVAAQSI